MKKFLMLVAILTVVWSAVSAQDNMMQPLPLNPKVKSGVLPNGMSYYILHNEEPRERANFYIAQKVGSSLEEQDQLGLAHFLEHMAFNGTTHYPGKAMLNYLQSKGIRFGADINAYTSFDETVYNINNVITTDKNLMDSVLLVLHDWSGDILLEEDEIEAERGVIEEEWRSGNSAQRRMMEYIFSHVYDEYQYQQSPIGKMEVVRNFKPEALRAYYKKWYRPDQQGIVIVGDFDADEMEKKVVDLFSTIVMPENAAPRLYPSVSDNEKPKFVSYTDPELTNLMTIISFKSDAVPFEFRNTLPIYLQETMVERLISTMINNRLNEFAQTPECNYAFANVNFGNFYVSKTKASFDVMVISKTDSRAGVEDAMSVVARACKAGFNEVEFDRAKDELMASIEKAYNQRDKTSNETLGRELCSFFIDNEAAPGIETEYQIWQMMLPQLPLMAIQEEAKELLSERNMVVATSAPKADGFEIVSEEAMLSTLANVMNAEYEALAEDKITDPLIPALPAPGKILSDEVDSKLGARVLNLSNGIKVILKSTDFGADQVEMTAYRKGGKQLYVPGQASDVLLMDDVYDYAKLGQFDAKTLKKYLAGKNVALNLEIEPFNDILKGNSTVKDLPYLFELIYASFTELNPDRESFDVEMGRVRPMLENSEKNPQTIFLRQIDKSRYNNPLMDKVGVSNLDNIVYSQSFGLLHDVLGNPADYTFIFVGNINPSEIDPLIEQYLASLPTEPVLTPEVKTEITSVKGQVKDEFTQVMEIPATMVYNLYSQSGLPYTLENDIMVEILGDILDNIYTDTLREEEGGTYSPFAKGFYSPEREQWNIVAIFFTNADQQEKIITRANDELMNLFSNGVDEVNFNKAKEAMIKQYEIKSRDNSYWTKALSNQLMFPHVDIVNEYGNVLQKVNLEQFNGFVKNLYNGDNRIQVIMQGVSAQ